MSKPYDAAGKELLQSDPVGWAALLGVVRPPEKIELRDSELSTITAAADKVLYIKDEPSWLMNVEFLSWPDVGAPRQLQMYSGLLQQKYEMPVASVLVLLAPKADASVLTGEWKNEPPFGPMSEFRYSVVRLWEMSVELFLEGPLNLLPIAPMAKVEKADLPALAEFIGKRLHSEANLAEGSRIVTIISVLMRLRYNAMFTDQFIESIPDLDEYPGFKSRFEKGLRKGREEGLLEGREEGLLEGRVEGRVDEARTILLRQGRRKFGPPSSAHEATITSADLARLEFLTERLIEVSTWDELLAAP